MRDVRNLACADSVMDRDLQASASIKEDTQPKRRAHSRLPESDRDAVHTARGKTNERNIYTY